MGKTAGRPRKIDGYGKTTGRILRARRPDVGKTVARTQGNYRKTTADYQTRRLSVPVRGCRQTLVGRADWKKTGGQAEISWKQEGGGKRRRRDQKRAARAEEHEGRGGEDCVFSHTLQVRPGSSEPASELS